MVDCGGVSSFFPKTENTYPQIMLHSLDADSAIISGIICIIITLVLTDITLALTDIELVLADILITLVY